MTQEAARRRPSLEQRRAVVHSDKSERAAASLLAQLNAIRNAKAAKRAAANTAKRAAKAKDAAKEEAWRNT